MQNHPILRALSSNTGAFRPRFYRSSPSLPEDQKDVCKSAFTKVKDSDARSRRPLHLCTRLRWVWRKSGDIRLTANVWRFYG
jgi:hypothetical protein